ncbi:MAG TPA: pantetheine-phosphate adenylyltransferase, partial [Nitrospirae bacterium]|nr:pantetheine-phosphate adenylyltransferase [Nitrospirota bacterium]
GARAASFDNLLMNYAEETGSIAVVRGLRAVSDFEYELQMALMNRRLNANIETVFMMPDQEYIFLSSTIVKEVLSFGGSVKGLVPQAVEKAINKKITRLHA